MNADVLVLDGDQRSALAAVRSLGKAGLQVLVGESRGNSLAGSSKYCAGSVVYASPYRDPEAFVRSVVELAREHAVQVLMPMTDVTTGICITSKARFDGLRLALPDAASFHRLTNKQALAEFAATLGVPVPLTFCVNSLADLSAAVDRFKPPFVIKPTQSKIWFRDEWIATSVQYAASVQQLRDIVARLPWLGTVPILIQEYIAGQGQGVFALYDRGAPLVWFSHRRIREKPPSGGISVVSESVPLDANMRLLSQKLLSAAQWHGVAMVEFKVRTDGRPYVIEVNGRFWGSLQLAVDAGVDFPYLLYKLAMGEPIDAPQRFEIGQRCRWLMGDLDHLYLVLKGHGVQAGVPEKLGAIASFLNFFRPRTRFEVNRMDDMKPFLRELQNYFGK